MPPFLRLIPALSVLCCPFLCAEEGGNKDLKLEVETESEAKAAETTPKLINPQGKTLVQKYGEIKSVRPIKGASGTIGVDEIRELLKVCEWKHEIDMRASVVKENIMVEFASGGILYIAVSNNSGFRFGLNIYKK